jgi:hypothetical protein
MGGTGSHDNSNLHTAAEKPLAWMTREVGAYVYMYPRVAQLDLFGIERVYFEKSRVAEALCRQRRVNIDRTMLLRLRELQMAKEFLGMMITATSQVFPSRSREPFCVRRG